MIIAVCGGRSFGDIATLQRKFPLEYKDHPLWERREAEYQFVFRTLSFAAAELSRHYRIDEPWQATDLEIVTGCARGADAAAVDWAKSNLLSYRVYEAEWERHGPNYAGPIRNQEILDKERPNLLIAFPGYRGTADMIRRAKRAKIEIRKMTQNTVITMEGNTDACPEF